jgi:penicillin amidase
LGPHILKYLNIAILGCGGFALAGVYWFGWRPLPRLTGAVRAPLDGRATIERDRLGVPHIVAGSIADALFAQGYATAQDRLWQMDALRRMAGGTLAAVAGRDAIDSDREALRMRLARLAEREAATLAESERAGLAAYARGVNAFIEANRARLPFEFRVLRYDPAPWRVRDSLVIGMYLYRALTSTWRTKLQKARMLEGGDPAKLDFLFSARPGEGQPGSNAWVLAGSRTASGKPLLANDPHLPYSIPSVWHMVHLRAPGLNVEGVTMPGLPCVIIGHNDRIGWGVTNLQADVQDLYIERLDPSTGRYLFRGRMEQAEFERDIIQVKGGAPVEVARWVTRHGPVMEDRGRFLALRWTGAEPDGFAFPFLDINRARDWNEFTAALARYGGPGQNFVFADVDGNIGYQAAGRIPIRKNFDGSVPVDGSTGEYEWDGYIPFEDMPRSYNPPDGLLVTANDNPFRGPNSPAGNFAPPYRAAQIRCLLSKRGGWRPAEMVSVQKDVYSEFFHFLAREAVAAWNERREENPDLSEFVAVLRPWDGQMEKGPAPLLAFLIYEHLRMAAADRASPGKALEYDPNVFGKIDTVQVAPVAIESLLRERPKDWFDDYDELLITALRDSAAEARRVQGRKVSKWDWSVYNRLYIAHPVGSRLPLIGKYFSIGPVRQSGSPLSVKQTSSGMGPSMRMTLDFSDLDQSLWNLAGGESGHLLSGHYKDQWEAYYYARSFPMEFFKVGVEDKLVLLPE